MFLIFWPFVIWFRDRVLGVPLVLRGTRFGRRIVILESELSTNIIYHASWTITIEIYLIDVLLSKFLSTHMNKTTTLTNIH